MSLRVWQLHFIDSLRSGLSQIREDLGADWPLFSESLLVLMERLIRTADGPALETIVDELKAQAATVSERSEYLSHLLLKAQPAHRGGREETRPSREEGRRSEYPGVRGYPIDGRGSQNANDRIVDHADMRMVIQSLANDLKADKPRKDAEQSATAKAPEPQVGGEPLGAGPKVAEDTKACEEDDQQAEKKPRYFNTFFTETDSETIVPQDQSLRQKKSYKLYVEINPERKGPGGDDVFVDNAVSGLQKSGETISLLVVAASHDFEIKPGVDKIDLPSEGPSTKARFSVRPMVSGERGVLQVEVFYRGHLLQAKRIEAMVVSDSDFELPISSRPAQSARLTFTTTERFSADTFRPDARTGAHY